MTADQERIVMTDWVKYICQMQAVVISPQLFLRDETARSEFGHGAVWENLQAGDVSAQTAEGDRNYEKDIKLYMGL